MKDDIFFNDWLPSEGEVIASDINRQIRQVNKILFL